jgi:hypothetical protein
MKKIVTLCFFALALCFTSQTINAQSLLEINTKANEKANELRSKIKFDTKVLEDVYQAYKAYETKIQSIDKNTELNSQASIESKAKTKEELITKLKGVFTEEQFEVYLSLEN